MKYSSPGWFETLPAKAIEPPGPRLMSTQNGFDGTARPRSSLFGAPSSGCSQSATRVPSSPPTRSDFPSGIQIERARLRSIARVTTVSRPPSAGATWTSLTLFGSPSRGYQKAIRAPSGENDGNPSSVLREVSRRAAPVATSRTITMV